MGDDLRLYITQLTSTGGPVMKDAGRAALNSGKVETYREFLNTGQYLSRSEDERVRATQLISVGGPEVKAAARIALEGPTDLLHNFIQTEQYKAQQKDELAATHVAQVAQRISEAARVAAAAQKSAAEANAAAATERAAAAEAGQYAQQARDSAAEADTHAKQAAQSAKEAESSAAAAAASARTARQAEGNAQRAAVRAVNSAADAQRSANWARSSADTAWGSANQARSAATAAGKDADAAEKARVDTLATVILKQREEEAQRRQVLDAWDQDYGPDERINSDDGGIWGWVPDWLKDGANTVANYGQAILTNSDVWLGGFESALGVVMMAGGAGGDIGGGAICLTGIGCLAGAPAIALSTGLIVGGAYTAADGVGRFNNGLGTALREAESTPTGKADEWLSQASRDKVPDSLKQYEARNRKGVGVRWNDRKGNGVRIDKVEASNSQEYQQVDHVVINSGGKVIGRDGKPITGSIREDAKNAHIPLEEWIK
ncbi:hypothetical protein ACIPW5_36405 [Streptomyces sp. NPDC090077]|uniref:ALF repeat-containing protein n=1 Tax=Streptomyces sp. NPDC090077 TaxID=3365938 RepID=UPI003803FC52